MNSAWVTQNRLDNHSKVVEIRISNQDFRTSIWQDGRAHFSGLLMSDWLTSILYVTLQVAFENVGAVSTQAITKQRKKEQPAVQAELERQIHRLKSMKESSLPSK